MEEKPQWGCVSSPGCWTYQPGINLQIWFHGAELLAWDVLCSIQLWDSLFFAKSGIWGHVQALVGARRKKWGGWSRFKDTVRRVDHEGRQGNIWDGQGFNHLAAHGMYFFIFKIFPYYLRLSVKYSTNDRKAPTRKNVDSPASTWARKALGGGWKKRIRTFMLIMTCFVQKKPPPTLYFWQHPEASCLCSSRRRYLSYVLAVFSPPSF